MPRASAWDLEQRGRQVPPPTLPRLVFTAGQDDVKEAAERFVTTRIIRAGRDAWEEIARTESFESWKVIGRALLIGRKVALAHSGANRAMGQLYSKSFNAWAKQHGFAAMKASTRSVAIELAENENTITAWRDGLPARQRKRLIHPLSVTRRWRAATQYNGKCPADLKRDAVAAWRRFVSCVRSLPADQAMPLWQAVSAEAAAMTHG
ncbi:MAG: hypothetical protein WAV38_15510 [Xanthobacteraceae bacterium]